MATKECERQGLIADGEAKRRILGEPIVKGIRFPVMKEAEFSNVVIDTLLKYYSLLNSSLEFSKAHRSGIRDDRKENGIMEGNPMVLILL